MHKTLQPYFDKIYRTYDTHIKVSQGDEIYGELLYYSAVKLLKHLKLTPQDHFLDIGSGLGKLVFQIFLTTQVASVTGIEINHARHGIAENVKQKLQNQFPTAFNQNRQLNLIHGDFLKHDFETVTQIYVCSTVFSGDLLRAIAEKVNAMSRVQTIVSLRKLPHLTHFKLSKKLFLHASWDYTTCYLYTRKNLNG